MDGVRQDIRYALRILVKTPGFTFAAILTLTLGIGANVGMFSVVYGVLLRSLPYRDGDRLVLPRGETVYAGAHGPVPILVGSTEFDAWQRSLGAIATPAFYAGDVRALSSDGGSEVLNSSVVSGTFFSTLGGPFAAGRPLEPGDDMSPSAVVSERLARRLFGDPQRAVGQTLILTSRAYAVTGVAASAFQFPSGKIDVWLPAGFARSLSARCCSFRVIARLNPSATLERARAAVEPAFRAAGWGLGAEAKDNRIRTSIIRLADDIVAPVRPALLMLSAAVSLVLVIACSNLINLLLARNAAREREFAVRTALGASRSRLVRQLLIETAVLTAIGSACGLVVARTSLIALSEWVGAAMPRVESIRIDPVVLMFAACLAALATIGTGVIPALRAVDGLVLSSQGSGSSVTRRSRRLPLTMCVVQVALALTLLITATLLGRSLTRLLHVDLGVSTDHVLTASISLAFGQRPTDVETNARVNRLIERIQALPGVRAVGVGTSLPPAASRIRLTLKRKGDAVDYQAAGVPATPGYFSALQTRLIKGRLFTDADDDNHPPVAIMCEDTARRFFGSDDPVGRTLTLPVLRNGQNSRAEMTVVGIIANVAYAGLGAPPDDAVYRPFAQQPWPAPYLVVRTAGNPTDFAPTLRREIAAADRGIVTSSVIALDQLVADAAAQPHFRTMLLATLAGLALGIAVVGLYGVVAYTVSQRSKEIAIRIALGATSHDVLAMVLRDGLIVAAAGIAAGVATGWGLSRMLAGLLYGITPTDPVSFLLAAIGLFLLTLLASYIPARRAARIDPIGSLRAE